ASLAWSSLLCLSLATAAKPLSNLLFGTSDYWDLIALALATIPLVLATTYFQDVLRLLQQPARYVLISFLLTGLTVAFVLWLVLVRDMGIEAIFLGALLAAPLPLVVAWWFVRGK